MPELWCPFATRRPGPTWKQGYVGAESPPGSPKTGVAEHSAEGYRVGIRAVIAGPRTASFQFAIFTDGELEQYYPVLANCWHCGDRDRDDNVDVEGMLAGNIDLVGIEYAGRVGEPLTELQYQKGLRLYRWLERPDVCNFPPASRVGVWPEKTLWEHGEVSGTACPSGRIPWERKLKDLTAMPGKTLTREQCINIYKAERAATAKHLKEFWKYIFALMGWAWPDDLY